MALLSRSEARPDAPCLPSGTACGRIRGHLRRTGLRLLRVLSLQGIEDGTTDLQRCRSCGLAVSAVPVWRNVRATHGFVAEDYLRAIGAALPGVYLPAMERVRLAWLEIAPAEGDGSDHAPGAGEGHFPTGTVAVPRPSQGRLPAGFLGSVEQRVEMLFVEPGLRGRGIGTALLEDFGSRHPEILLDVNEQNTAARIFYARRGFEVVGRSPLDGAGQPYPLLPLRRVRAGGAGAGQTA